FPSLIWSLLRLLLLARAWHHRHMLDRDLAISPLRGDQRAAKAALQIEYDATTRHRARGFYQAFGGGTESLLYRLGRFGSGRSSWRLQDFSSVWVDIDSHAGSSFSGVRGLLALLLCNSCGCTG